VKGGAITAEARVADAMEALKKGWKVSRASRRIVLDDLIKDNGGKLYRGQCRWNGWDCPCEHPLISDCIICIADKEFNIGDAAKNGFSRERILSEITKCTTLCANCHRILHWNKTYGV
jgi:hypothetical protein